MKLVGLTGGIGSGKSTVAKIFKLLDIPVFDSDQEAKRLMTSDQELRNSIILEFGPDAYLNSAEVNRQYLASVVFNNRKKLDTLNSLVHPIVRQYIKKWANEQKSRYVIVESALLFEYNLYKNFDAVITVIASTDIRIQRVMQRSNLSYEEILKRVQNQVDDSVRYQKSTHIIENNNHNLLIPQVLTINNQLWESSQNG